MWPEKKNQLYLAQIAICVIMKVPPSQNRKILPHLVGLVSKIAIDSLF